MEQQKALRTSWCISINILAPQELCCLKHHQAEDSSDTQFNDLESYIACNTCTFDLKSLQCCVKVLQYISSEVQYHAVVFLQALPKIGIPHNRSAFLTSPYELLHKTNHLSTVLTSRCFLHPLWNRLSVRTSKLTRSVCRRPLWALSQGPVNATQTVAQSFQSEPSFTQGPWQGSSQDYYLVHCSSGCPDTVVCLTIITISLLLTMFGIHFCKKGHSQMIDAHSGSCFSGQSHVH